MLQQLSTAMVWQVDIYKGKLTKKNQLGRPTIYPDTMRTLGGTWWKEREHLAHLSVTSGHPC